MNHDGRSKWDLETFLGIEAGKKTVPSKILSMAALVIPFTAVSVAVPQWGAIMILFNASKGWSRGNGSGSVTSKAAKWIFLFLKTSW